MGMHKTNSLLKYAAIPVIILMLIFVLVGMFHEKHSGNHNPDKQPQKIKNIAANDSAAESLDTLTADLSVTRKAIQKVAKENEFLKKQNLSQIGQARDENRRDNAILTEKISQIEEKIQHLLQHPDIGADDGSGSATSSISIVEDLSHQQPSGLAASLKNINGFSGDQVQMERAKPVPWYTIPANATSVHDRLMTALVGRIPVKGVVTDPYPFKIVISDDNLAANGLRIPHLSQMIVSGYCEGDLNLVSVRGWVTSLTFIFDDGTISSVTSNDNNIGHFTRENSLGYLSDKFGNPFIRGRLISNAPLYLSGNATISAAAGAANAFAQSQTTQGSSLFGNSSAMTGDIGKYVAGNALSSVATGVQQWWHDREEQSFDAVYVAPADDKGKYQEIAVNFAKEIPIDYDPEGRKISYAHVDKITDDIDPD